MKFGKDWKAVTEYVGTRDIGLIRSHCQKLRSKLSKIIDSDGKLKLNVTKE